MKITPERILILKVIENHNVHTHRRATKDIIRTLTGISWSCINNALKAMIEYDIVNGPGKGYPESGYSLTPKGRKLIVDSTEMSLTNVRS